MNQHYWAIIVNPVAGRGDARCLASSLSNVLGELGADVSVLTTGARGHAERLAIKAVNDGASRVVACGGDGTVHEVVNGVMEAKNNLEDVAVGILPAGRCNDLAYGLGFPKNGKDMVSGLLHGDVRAIDIARIGKRYFTTIATLGFDSEVSQYVDEGSHPSFLRGTAAYLYGAIVKLFKYDSCWVKLKGDFGEFEGDIFLVATGNTTRYGGRMHVVPSAIVDDGWLDICLVKPARKLEIMRMIPKTFNGGHVDHPAVSIYQTRTLQIESRKPLWIWADGERITETPATIEVVPGALRVLVSR